MNKHLKIILKGAFGLIAIPFGIAIPTVIMIVMFSSLLQIQILNSPVLPFGIGLTMFIILFILSAYVLGALSDKEEKVKQ